MKRLSQIDLSREQSEAVIVGPDDAAWALDRNGNNRNMSRSVWNRYAAAMTAGKWLDMHPDPLLFNGDGQLMNGQHRLRAILASGVHVVMLVRTMQHREMVMAIDSGYKRVAADQIRLFCGKQVDSVLLASIRLWDVDNNCIISDRSKRMNRTPQEIIDLIDAHQMEIGVADRIMNHKVAGVAIAAVGCALLVAAKARGKMVGEFAEDLLEVVPHNRTIALLRSWLVAPATLKMNSSSKYMIAYERTVTAINYWLAGRELRWWPTKLARTVEGSSNG